MRPRFSWQSLRTQNTTHFFVFLVVSRNESCSSNRVLITGIGIFQTLTAVSLTLLCFFFHPFSSFFVLICVQPPLGSFHYFAHHPRYCSKPNDKGIQMLDLPIFFRLLSCLNRKRRERKGVEGKRFACYEGILISFASKSITLEIMKTNKWYLHQMKGHFI